MKRKKIQIQNKLCEVCGDKFIKESKYCSSKCFLIYLHKHNVKPRKDLVCLNCKKIFHSKRVYEENERKYCSRKCSDEHMKVLGIRRENSNGHWKGGIHNTCDGYLRYGYGEKYMKYQHRFLYEKEHGVHLTSNDIVHHIDGNRKNNDISNLEAMTRSEHMNLHRNELMAARKARHGH